MRRILRGALAAVVVTAGTIALPAVPAGAGTSRQVTIDLKPGAADNAVNLAGKGALPVAILTTSSFDATTVDPLSVCFGDAENATQRDCTEAHGTGHVEDADGDGDNDLLLHYDAEAAGLDAGDTRACLEGLTLGGGRIHACDAATIRNGTPEANLPDLTPPVVASPTSTGPGGVVTWTATLTNEGTGAITFAPGTNVIRLDVPAALSLVSVATPAGFTCTTPTATAHVCATDDPVTLLAGGTVGFPVSGAMPSLPGPVTVNATADPDNLVVESDETDNTRGATAVVDPANLTTTLDASPAALAPGEPLTLTAVVKNTGTVAAFVPAGTTLVRFDLPAGFAPGGIAGPAGTSCSGVTCATTAARTLAVGAELSFTLGATAPSAAGPYTAAAKADPGGVVDESDEADNTATASLLVELANLVTTATTVTDPVAASAPVRWTSDLVNLGPGKVRIPAGARAISFTFSEPVGGVTVTAPAGYTCVASSTTVHTCTTTALTTLLAGQRAAFTIDGTAPAAPTTLTMTATADPAGVVAEADETDNATVATSRVVRGNLTISATPAANPVDAVASTRWDYVVTNDGPALDLPSGAHLFRFSWPAGFTNVAVATPSGFSCFIVDTNTADCAATSALTIPAGGTVTGSVFGTSPRQPGDLTLTFTVDPLSVVEESNEADNTALATTVVQPPDLRMTLTATPDPAEAGFTTTWVARITNDGPSNARISTGMTLIRFAVPSGMVNLAVSTPTGYTCFLSATLVVDCSATSTQNIPAGGFVDITLFGTAPRDPGTISTTATADPLGAIPEGDETDNAATTSLTVRGPDLAVTLTATPNPANAAHTTTWASRITNNGPGRARIPNGTTLVRWNIPAGMTNLAVSTPAGMTCFLASTNVVECTTTASATLDVGAFYDVTLFGTAPRALAPITMTITVDPLGGVPEENESNNAATLEVPVQGPNFTITTTATPSPANASHSVTWASRITNTGPAPARIPTGSTLLRFEVPAGLTNLAVSTPSTLTCFIATTNVVECTTTATMALAVDGTFDVSFFGTAPRVLAPITMTITVDPLDTTPEENESDNVSVTTTPVQGPDLTITSFTATPDPADAAHTVTWTGRIVNNGPAPLRLPTGTTAVRLDIPTGLTNLAISTPSGFTCFLATSTVIECDSTATTTLAVGGFWDVTLFATMPREPGTVAITLSTDSDGTVPEEDETNNAATTSVAVRPPDFSTTVTAAAGTISAGGTAEWVVRVANDGPAVARFGAAHRIVRIDLPAGLTGAAVAVPANYECVAPASTFYECRPLTTQSLAVGGVLQFTVTGTAPDPGTLSVTATADPLSVIPEADETDNAASASISVT